MLRQSLIATCLIFLFLISPASGEDRALVIGINQYPAITSNGVAGAKDLRGAVTDAKGFQNFLIENFGFKPEQVKLLVDGEATKQAILASFENWLEQGTKAGDRAVFFFAGHGAQTKDENGDEPQDDLFDETIAPADSSGELTASPVILGNLLLDDEIGAMFARIKDRRVFAFIDSCNSGTITRGLDGAVSENANVRTRTLTPRSPATSKGIAVIPNKNRQKHKVATILFDAVETGNGTGETVVWTATTSSQEALDLATGGLFTQSFLSAIRDRKADGNSDGVVSVAETVKYLQAESETACKQMPTICISGLTPTLDAPASYFAQKLAPFSAASTSPPEKTLPASVKAEGFFGHVNDFSLGVEVLPGRVLRNGDPVTFRISTDRDARLVLIDQSPDGSLTQIFPNKFASGDAATGIVRAGNPLTIPDAFYGFRFTATEKGESKLIALALEPETDLSAVLQPLADLQKIADADTYLDSISKELLAPVVTTADTEPNRRRLWSFTITEYSVND